MAAGAPGPGVLVRAGALTSVLLLSVGCKTTVGHFLAERARDLGECFALEVGVGPAVGVDVQVLGLVHVNAISTMLFGNLTVGWAYGEPRPYGAGDFVPWEGYTGLPVAPIFTGFLHAGGQVRRRGTGGHGCYFLLPAVFSWSDRKVSWKRWLWSERTDVWNRVHAFDIEVAVAAGVGVRAGFSPGEFLDFLLGWVGIDIAGDDAPWEGPIPDKDGGAVPSPTPSEGSESPPVPAESADSPPG